MNLLEPLGLLPERLAAELPDGPVELYMAVYSADGAAMGVGPVLAPPCWRWHGGCLAVDYGDAHVLARERGVPAVAYLVAVAAGSRDPVMWRPALRLDLDYAGREVPAGAEITVTGTRYICFEPGEQNDPRIPPTPAGWQ